MEPTLDVDYILWTASNVYAVFEPLHLFCTIVHLMVHEIMADLVDPVHDLVPLSS